MKAPLTVSLVSFYVPDTVQAEPFPVPVRPAKPPRTDFTTPPASPNPYFSVPLCELDSDTLDTLCGDFRRSVFKTAGKDLPLTSSAPTPNCPIPLKALDTLKAVLCDAEGNVSVPGSPQDIHLIQRALHTLDVFLNQL